MENHSATIDRNDEKTDLVLKIDTKEFRICLTDDSPGDIKNVFNLLIIELKKGKFEFSLTDATQDLFHHICAEYIKQLNGEIADVFSQLKKYELIEPK
jgi:hypothetical protein